MYSIIHYCISLYTIVITRIYMMKLTRHYCTHTPIPPSSESISARSEHVRAKVLNYTSHVYRLSSASAQHHYAVRRCTRNYQRHHLYRTLHDAALAALLAIARLHHQSDTGRLGEGFIDTAVLLGRALEISQRVDAPRHVETLVVINTRLLLLLFGRGIFLVGIVVIRAAQIALERHQHELHTGTIVGNLANPFGLDVFERILAVDGEAQENGMRVVVR